MNVYTCKKCVYTYMDHVVGFPIVNSRYVNINVGI